jgi:hypothetical protein
MLQWLTRHYPRTSITRRPPILSRDYWYCASFYINISLPGVPFTFFAADPTISNTFRDQPSHLHYLTAQIHHAAPSDQTGFFRFPDIHSMASTGTSEFQFAENHFFPLGMQLPSQRPGELEEALSDLSEQILFLHRRFAALLVTDPMPADDFQAAPEIVIIDSQGTAPETCSLDADQSAVYSRQQPQVHMPKRARKNGAHGLQNSAPLPHVVSFGCTTRPPAPRHKHTKQPPRPHCPLLVQLPTTPNPAQAERGQHIQPEHGTQPFTYSSSTDPVLIQDDIKRPRPHDRIRAAAFFHTDILDQAAPETGSTDGSGIAQEVTPPHTDQPPAHFQQQPQVHQQILARKNGAHGLRTSVPLAQFVSFRTNNLDRQVIALPAPTQEQRGRNTLTPQLQHKDQLPRSQSPLRSHHLLSKPNPAQAKRRRQIQTEHGMQSCTHSLRTYKVPEQSDKRPLIICHITAASPPLTHIPPPKASTLNATTSAPITGRYRPHKLPRKDSGGLTPNDQVSAPLPRPSTTDPPLSSSINNHLHHVTRTNDQAADRFLRDLADRTPVTDVILHRATPTSVPTRTSSKSTTRRSREATRQAKSRAGQILYKFARE